MYAQDYEIKVRFVNRIPYFEVYKKGALYKCNNEELALVAKAFKTVKSNIDAYLKKSEVPITNNQIYRKININNPEELKKFKLETHGFVSSYGFPYKLDDITEKGANYTIFCPLRWKSAFSPVKLHKLLKEDVDADIIKVQYIDFVRN